MKKLFLILGLLLLFSSQLFALTVSGTVVSIYDGDTLKIRMLDEEGKAKIKTVRMLGIDTPEINFNGHSQGEIAFVARDYLRSIVPLGESVDVRLESEWQLGQRRMLGTVFFQAQDINLKLLESGLAAPYFIAPFEKKLLHNYLEAARVAYQNKLGIFALGDEMPYEFRMRAQNREGTNFVGNVETKTLYYPNEVSQILPYKRVFIKGLKQAQSLGYRLRE